jgi:hypothetical protein
MASSFATATGAALLGVDARLLTQEYRRVLAPPGSCRSRGPLQLGFRELLYFRVVGELSAEGLQLRGDPGQAPQASGTAAEVARSLLPESQKVPRHHF